MLQRLLPFARKFLTETTNEVQSSGQKGLKKHGAAVHTFVPWNAYHSSYVSAQGISFCLESTLDQRESVRHI